MSPATLTRRAVLVGAAVAALTGCTPAAPKPAAGAPMPTRHHYGPGAQQFGELYLPHTGRPRGTVVVIHGGFWQSAYSLTLGAATSADLAERGWAAWNVEYRRVGNGGGWPGTFDDVAAAVDLLARLDGVDTSRIVALGHSAGGQLAAWAASRHGSSRHPSSRLGGAPRVRIGAVVPQAGVLDLATAARSGLGGSAVPDLVGGVPHAVARRYAEVDPVERLPLGVPIRCIHGTDDTTVPLSQSTAYVDAARAAGDDAELMTVPGDHFALIDPTTAAWRRTVEVLSALRDVDVSS